MNYKSEKPIVVTEQQVLEFLLKNPDLECLTPIEDIKSGKVPTEEVRFRFKEGKK